MTHLFFNDTNFTPNNIFCIGRNYHEHIKELSNEVPQSMVLFNKPPHVISDRLELIYDDVSYEGELSFVIIGGELKGVAFGLDLTRRDLQNELKSKGLPWERSKTFRSSAIFSPFVRFDNIKDLHLELYINGELRQNGGYDLMIHKPQEIIEEIKTFLDIKDYDCLMSGTPCGVGLLKKGDLLHGEIKQAGKTITSLDLEVK